MRSYQAARNLYGFLGFLAWCAIVAGVFIFFAGGNAASQMNGFGRGTNELAILAAIMPGTLLTFFGIMSLAVVQNGRASVDTAEYTQQMLQLARDQLEVSRQGLRQAAPEATSFNHTAAPAEVTPSNGYETPAAANFAPAPQPVVHQTATAPAATTNTVTTYNGRKIHRKKGTFIVDDQPFYSLQDAQQYIDRNPMQRR